MGGQDWEAAAAELRQVGALVVTHDGQVYEVYEALGGNEAVRMRGGGHEFNDLSEDWARRHIAFAAAAVGSFGKMAAAGAPALEAVDFKTEVIWKEHVFDGVRIVTEGEERLVSLAVFLATLAHRVAKQRLLWGPRYATWKKHGWPSCTPFPLVEAEADFGDAGRVKLTTPC